jgi:hypothetical protein
MTTVYLNRSDLEFWDMSFRQIISLIEQWKIIEKNRDMMRAFIQNGGDPDEIETGETEKKHEIELAMGNDMW